MSKRARRAVVGTALAIGLALPPWLHAQTVRGTLLESGTSRPIALALVTLLNTDQEPVDRAQTDAAGQFELTAPEPGNYFVRAQQLGYRTKLDGILELGAGGKMTVEFYLQPAPIELAGIDVVAHRDWIELRQRRKLENAGFYHRKEYLVGQFITPEEIEHKNPFGLGDLLRGELGVRVVSSDVDGLTITLHRGAVGCPATVYVDGVRVHELYTVQAPDIAAVEIYRGAARVPIEYSGGGCGLVLFWTK